MCIRDRHRKERRYEDHERYRIPCRYHRLRPLDLHWRRQQRLQLLHHQGNCRNWRLYLPLRQCQRPRGQRSDLHHHTGQGLCRLQRQDRRQEHRRGEVLHLSLIHIFMAKRRTAMQMIGRMILVILFIMLSPCRAGIAAQLKMSLICFL